MSLYGYKPTTKPALWTLNKFGAKPSVAHEKPAKAKPERKTAGTTRRTINSVTAKKPRKTVNHVSKVRSAQLREYSRTVKAWKALPENRMCGFPGGCEKPTTDCHHSRGKVGALLTDARWWKPLCRTHHDWVGNHPVEARALGLIAPSGEWNTSPEQRKQTLDRNAALIQRGQVIHTDDAHGVHPHGEQGAVASNVVRVGSG